MLKIKRVVLAISGGVDSAVVALLLKQKGYNIQGVFMKNWDLTDENGYCSADEEFKDASYVCDKLKIELHKVDFVKHYWNEVFCELIKEYQNGLTPNPDVLCNRNIKFNYFYDYAKNNLEADAIATGHYARTSFGPYLEHFKPNEDVRLYSAKDDKKDQILFLCQVRQEALRRTMFPLGNLTKPQVKQLAIDNGLGKIAKKKESMGICFIGERNFQKFIQEYVDDRPGDFVNVDDGKVVGCHNGAHQWTLGQRAKLSGYALPFYIVKKDVENNIIYVAPGTYHPILYSDLIFTSKPYWIHSQPESLKTKGFLECKFKFQHIERWADCQLYETNKGLIIKLIKEQRAVTPGQYAVFSLNEECLGSAKIVESVSRFSLEYLNNNLKNIKHKIINNKSKNLEGNKEEIKKNHCSKKENVLGEGNELINVSYGV